MSCKVACSGFSVLRKECARDACEAEHMCRITHSNVNDCQSWCCENRSYLIFFIVFFFCLGSFVVCSIYYLHRLHVTNVQAGAVDENGEFVPQKAPEDEQEMMAARRVKRHVEIDPNLVQALQANKVDTTEDVNEL